MSTTTTTSQPTLPPQTPVSLDPTHAIPEILSFWFHTLQPEWWFQPPASLNLDAVITHKFAALVQRVLTSDALDAQFTATPEGTLALILLTDQFPRNIYRPSKPSTPPQSQPSDQQTQTQSQTQPQVQTRDSSQPQSQYGDPNANESQAHLSWSGDAKALRLTTHAIAHDTDLAVQRIFASAPGAGYYHRSFFYLPLEHAEDLLTQITAVAKMSQVAAELEIRRLDKVVRGEGEESVEERKTREWALASRGFAERHLVCVRELGRFPGRNVALGRESTEAELKWLEKYPMGF